MLPHITLPLLRDCPAASGSSSRPAAAAAAALSSHLLCCFPVYIMTSPFDKANSIRLNHFFFLATDLTAVSRLQADYPFLPPPDICHKGHITPPNKGP